MYLSRLHLRHFRSYSELTQEFSPRYNLLVGPNGAGKTNVLEAIFLLATARSHRASRDQELVQWGADLFRVQADIVKTHTTMRLELAYARDRRKQLRINGQPEAKISNLIGRLNVVLFAPEDLQLIKGAPALRRRFLDIELAQVSPAYFHHLQQYQRTLMQRNAALRKGAVASVLGVFDEPLIEHGCELIRRRAEAVAALEPLAAAHHEQISNGQETLALTYMSTLYERGGQPPADLPDRFRQLLAERRHVEEMRGTTVVGPHRDDLLVSLNGRDARQFASQGQQRSAVLSLKLAELAFVAAHAGEPPILLLDDVTSELDADRRALLVQTIAADVQTFITTTGLDDVDQRWLDGGAVFTVSDGELRPVGSGGNPSA